METDIKAFFHSITSNLESLCYTELLDCDKDFLYRDCI